MNEQLKFRFIPKTQLRIDPIYQRGLVSSQKLAKMRREFSWTLFGTLLVAERDDNTLYVVDGQQRLAAVMGIPGIDEVPCEVFSSSGSRQEAIIFKDRDSERTRISPRDQFRARVAGEEPLALELMQFIESRGYQVIKSSSPYTLQCIGTIYQQFTSSGGIKGWKRNEYALQGLDLAMLIAQKKYQIKADLFQGCYLLCQRKRGYGDPRGLDALGLKKLQRQSGEEIYRSIRNMKLKLGRESYLASALALLEIANHMRHSQNKITLPVDADTVEVV